MTGARILNVDDDEASRYVTTRALLRAGFEVTEAASGREALEKAENRPDLILLDVNLPDISGLEVCRLIKADPRYNSLAILHISAISIASQDRSEGLEGGADGYLVEPVEPRELVATVQAAIRIRRAEETARVAAARWEATFEAITDGVCLVDSQGSIYCSNGALSEALGLPQEALHSRSVCDLFRERLGMDVTRLREGVELQDERWSEDLEGRERWFRLLVSPVAGGGEIAGTVVVLEDITARKELERTVRDRAEERLRAAGEEARRALTQQLITAQESERHQISRELHDRSSQHLTALQLQLAALQRMCLPASPQAGILAQVQTGLTDLGEELHTVSEQLRPLVLDDMGLGPALVSYLEGWQARGAVAIEFERIGSHDTTIPPEIETTIYRVAQEGVSNVMRHAQATRVSVILEQRPGEARLVVEDNGCGFDAEAGLAVSERLGVRGMRERLALVGGTLEIESSPGAGTTLFLRVPLPVPVQ